MDARSKKSVLQRGRHQNMPVEAVAGSETSGKVHSSQYVAATDGNGAEAADCRLRRVAAEGCAMPAVGSANASADKAEAEAKRRFDAWRAKYEPIAREIYEKRSKRAESKRRRAKARRKAFGDLCEMTDGLASFCRKNGVSLAEGEWMLDQFRRPGPYAAVFVTMFFDIAWFGAVFLRKELTRRIDRARHEVCRPYYYGQEKARRQAMAEERRRIGRRSTHNPCPTREEIVDAWKKVKDSNEDLLRFGSLMEDLECYVDNSLVRDDSGAIIGRRSGIKGWLQMEIPALYTVYSRVMAYKAAAKRMRQIIELQDPLPLSSVLDMGTEGNPEMSMIQDYGADEIKNEMWQGGMTVGRADRKNSCANGMEHGEVPGAVSGVMNGVMNSEMTDIAHGETRNGTVGKTNGVPDGGGRSVIMGKVMDEMEEVALLRARAIYLEVIKPVGEGARRQTALIERMTKLTGPDSVEDGNMLEGWRRKYERKITVRTKSMWAERLVRMLA